MKVICLNNVCSIPPLVLPRAANKKLDSDNFTCYSGCTISHSIFGHDISVDKIYEVYGIMVYNGQTRYLIQDDRQIPVFCPSALFQINNTSVFWNWKVREFEIGNKKMLIISDDQFIDSYSKLIDLVDGKPSAVKSFLDSKKFMENYEM
jgi:hypothetical protein